MKYALRKLIAFVFLLGMVWYIFQDVDNIWNPGYMSAIGGLFAIFGAFWLVVPLAVVWIRIWKRTRKNRRGYELWRSELESRGLHPHHRNPRLNIDRDEEIWFREKGTFYVENYPVLDSITVKSRIGDVAFPHEPRVWRKAQRIHCYFTSRRILFLGKELDCDIPFENIVKFHPTVGGLVFEIKKGESEFRVAFTFVNPLIASDVLNRISKKSVITAS